MRTALEIAARHGFAAVSAREITVRLGVSPMAIYRHVPTMEQLRAEVANAALAEVADPDPDQDWRDQLHAFVGELVRVCRQYRGLESEPVAGEQPRRIVDVILRIVQSAGHTPDDAARTAQVILTLVVGHVHLLSPGPTQRPRPRGAEPAPPGRGSREGHWARVTETPSQDELLDDTFRWVLGALEQDL